MEKKEINSNIQKCIEDFKALVPDPNNSITYSAIKALNNAVSKTSEYTMQGILKELKQASECMMNISVENNLFSKTTMPLKAACDIFWHMVNKVFSSHLHEGIDVIKFNLADKGRELIEFALESRKRVTEFASQFIRDGLVLLIHGYSKVVEHILMDAVTRKIRFSVIVTEGRPNEDGYKTKKILEEANIPVKMIVDGAVGCMIQDCDYVLVGAEAVVENGGIINAIGTLSIAMCAKTFKKPFYVACESLKFVRAFPLTQSDLNALLVKKVETFSNPIADLTPPEYITLLFTDLGIFTPSAVSDELIQFYSN